MICKYCGAEMRLDDSDKYWNGSAVVIDYYYYCDSCNGSLIKTVLSRDNKWIKDGSGLVLEENWYKEV